VVLALLDWAKREKLRGKRVAMDGTNKSPMGGTRVKAVSKRALTIMPGLLLQGFFQKTYLPAQREI
jgi:NAD(P)H-dependent FMN reductase